MAACSVEAVKGESPPLACCCYSVYSFDLRLWQGKRWLEDESADIRQTALLTLREKWQVQHARRVYAFAYVLWSYERTLSYLQAVFECE